MKFNGKIKFAARQKTLSDLAELLSLQLGRSVTNATDLRGVYDVTLYYSSDMPRVRPGVESPGASDPTGPTLREAVQQQLGLLLEPGEGPVRFMIIDKVEKLPADN